MSKTIDFKVKPGKSFFVQRKKYRGGDTVALTLDQAKHFEALGMLIMPLELLWESAYGTDDKDGEPAASDSGQTGGGDEENSEESSSEQIFVSKRGKSSGGTGSETAAKA